MRNLILAAGVLASVSICACAREGTAKAEGAASTSSEAAPPTGADAAAPVTMPATQDMAVTDSGAAAASSGPGATEAAANTPITDSAVAAQGGVSVNGAMLDGATRAALQQAYGAVPDGRYWYDPLSGLWGVEKGPSVGRLMPGLALGGALRADASASGDGMTTGVFINGREIHPEEYALLAALFGYVNPGRYWLGPDLTGGYEGGPVLFDLKASAAGVKGTNAGGPGYNRSTLFGDLMSDGQCSGYLHPNGSTVMTGNC